jgi:hypothetical protein
MRIEIEIETIGAAFDCPMLERTMEIERLLKGAIERASADHYTPGNDYKLRDVNGNGIGALKVQS